MTDRNRAVRDELSGAISTNLRRLCDQKGSIAELCRIVGVNRQQMNKYLSGEIIPSLLTLQLIADATEISVDQLYRSSNPIEQSTANGSSEYIERSSTEGMFLEYTPSEVFDNHVLVCLSKIVVRNGQLVYRRKMPVRKEQDPSGRRYWNFVGTVRLGFGTTTIQYMNTTTMKYGGNYNLIDANVYSRDLIGIKSAYANLHPARPVASSVYFKRLDYIQDVRTVFRTQVGVFPLEELTDLHIECMATLNSRLISLPHLVSVSVN